MFLRPSQAFLLSLLLIANTASAQAGPVLPEELRAHIEILADDSFGGRAPGTEGEEKTIDYIVRELAASGLQAFGSDGGWFQPFDLVEHYPERHDARWTAGGRSLTFDNGDIFLMGRGAGERLQDAPVVFAGHGARMPGKGVDQLAGADFKGTVALILLEGPPVAGFPSLAERTQALVEAGAAAVVAIVGEDVPFDRVVAGLGRGTTRLAATPKPAVAGVITQAAAARLVQAAGQDLGRLLNEQPGSSFRAVPLPLRATLDVATRVNRFTTRNVVARLPGSSPTGEAVVFLAHWDHLGECGEGEDRICNGAVDNASGIAALIETADRLARTGPHPRDIVFLATSAEEVGLLGAQYFVDHPLVPLDRIAAAVNIDTIAIHSAGSPVAVIGRGNPSLDAAVGAAATALGRPLDEDGEADAFIERQDGWAFTRAGVPAIMVGGSFSDVAQLTAFLQSDYHGPGDELRPDLPLDGAAEDTNLMVELGRRLADPALFMREATSNQQSGN